jgi:hypothetical protein
MTSPVEMDGPLTMKCMHPAERAPAALEAPNYSTAKFTTGAERALAAIAFGGFANDERIVERKNALRRARPRRHRTQRTMELHGL